MELFDTYFHTTLVNRHSSNQPDGKILGQFGVTGFDTLPAVQEEMILAAGANGISRSVVTIVAVLVAGFACPTDGVPMKPIAAVLDASVVQEEPWILTGETAIGTLGAGQALGRAELASVAARNAVISISA